MKALTQLATTRASNIPWRAYYWLAKPGIVYGNGIAVLAGYFYGLTTASFSIVALVAVLAGTSLVMAGACVFNNYTDRYIDAKMERTNRRALVTGIISPQAALVYAAILLALGFSILALWTNSLTVLIGVLGVVDYVLVYAWAKRTGPLGTLVGTVSGSTPPLAGYTAITGEITQAAILLFLLMVFWQMAHFYAIAVYRIADYKRAGIPVLPAVKNVLLTRQRILVYIVLFAATALYFSYKAYAPWWFALVLLLVSAVWFVKAADTIHKREALWAKTVFRFSLLVLVIFCLATALVGILTYLLAR